MSRRFQLPGVSLRTGLIAVLASVIAAAVAAPFAGAFGDGKNARGGARNPSSNASLAYSNETQIIANTSTYGTRQSNKGSGGGAVYGCRSVAATSNPLACLRASNLKNGLAFSIGTGGPVAGEITAVGGDNAKPFTTNATGVATGLNADRVDSLDASQIVSQAAAQGATDGAKSAVSTIQSGLNFAQVTSTGTLGTNRGAASATRTADGRYQVVFSGDVSKCALGATESTTENAGAVGVSLGSDNKTVSVVTRTGGGDDGTGNTAVTDRPFHLTATC